MSAPCARPSMQRPDRGQVAGPESPRRDERPNFNAKDKAHVMAAVLRAETPGARPPVGSRWVLCGSSGYGCFGRLIACR